MNIALALIEGVTLTDILTALFTGASALFLAAARRPYLDVTDWAVGKDSIGSQTIGCTVVSTAPARVVRIDVRAKVPTEEEWSVFDEHLPNAAVGPGRSYRLRRRLQAGALSNYRTFSAEDTYVYVEITLWYRFLWIKRSESFNAGVTIQERDGEERTSIVSLEQRRPPPAYWPSPQGHDRSSP